jgi:hypothetical protein
MSKLQWESLPPACVALVEKETGTVVKAESVIGGLMPGLTAVVHAEHGRYFVKAAPADSPAAHLYEREMAVGTGLPASVPAPRMCLSCSEDGWLLVFDFEDARDADLSPGSPDLDGVLAALTTMSNVRAWDALSPVAANVTALTDKAAALLAAQPGAQPWEMYRAAIDGFDTAALTGDRLTHYDLHSGNVKVSVAGDVAVVDWAFACAGAAWIDAVVFVPRLIEAGHSAAAAERLISRMPGWRMAPASGVTALAALWTMFREYKARYGPVDVRPFRERAATAGRSWLEYRMR